MAGDSGLPPQLVSLIHHIELNKAGWWDRAIERLAVATIWLAGTPLTAHDIIEKNGETFSITLDPGRLVARLDSLCEQGILIRLPNEEFKISETSLKKLEEDLADAEGAQNAAKARFVELLQQYCPSASPEDTWKTFNEDLLVPLVRELGARTYKVVSAAGLDIEQSPRLENFFKSYPGQDRDSLRRALGAFLDPHSDVARSYILRYLNVHFFLEAAALSQENLKTLTSMPVNPSFTLLLDTNVLFSVLGLHDNPSNEAAVLLVKLVTSLQATVSGRLFACAITIKEMRDVLLARQGALQGLTITPNMVEPAKKAGVGSVTLNFMEQARSPQGVTAYDYFQPYVHNLVKILRSKGVEFHNAQLGKYKTDQRVIDDTVRQLEYEKKHSNRPKTYEAIEHDVILWYFVRDNRPSPIESPADAKYWIVTLDFGLLGFDAFKRHQLPDKVPICIHPTTLISLLQFWVPRSALFDEAIIGSLRLPFLFQEFDPDAERVTVRILQVLSRYENVGDLSEETISDVLLSEALRQKIITERGVEEQTQLIKEALIEEDKKVRKALNQVGEEVSQLRKADEDKKLAIEALEHRVENDTAEKRELLQRIENAQKNFKSEQEAKESLEAQINQQKDVERLRVKREAGRRFLAAWGIVSPLLITAAGWVTDLFGHGSWRLDTVIVCVLVVIWMLLASWDGNRRPTIRDTNPFKGFLKTKRWLFFILGTLALGVVANALWEAFK